MFRAVLTGSLLLISSTVWAFQFPIEMIEGIDGARVVININKQDLDDDPRWIPFESAPPITIAGALDIVQSHLAKNPALKDAILRDIQLRRIPHHENNWHYMVVIQTSRDGSPVLHYYAVLMSGKLITAIREPESYK
ncbi:hypothetical protein DFR30_2317 [Thiogranum longum]|uniref:PepSY domain-containing protein n=1 Tax=Thiogranum longum TaxID=1537524 RepID=A0A4R1HAN9_9GAMM|nr:hypothetical protein [Thiogranum longum]TCK19024.1 hypothetical protein DFR30_2317 [Thiogranum longum]